MPPNLVILSLDAVSQTLFWQYREAMPTLWNLYNRSAMFRRFYSASTSAFQSFSDLVHGDAAELDHNTRFPAGPGCFAGRATNLFALLRDRGYLTLGIQHGSADPEYAGRNFYGAWPDGCGQFRRHGEYAPFHSEIESFFEHAKAGGKPFVAYISDRVARPDDASPEKAEAVLYHERFEKGYALLDNTAGRVLKKLEELALLPNTIVAAFGPYGMDPWKHGIYRGRAIGIDPYADICWTPMMLYNNNNDIGTADQLFSVIDLKPTLMHLLFPDEQHPPARNILAGIDILLYRRQIALTQSLFALERENEGPALGMMKSYAATDGDQRLIVSSNGGIAGEGGMELYFDPRDPGNTRDFLDFFDLDQNGVMTAFGRRDIVHVHFTQSFKQNLVMSIVESYNKMRELLYNFIRFKEQEAQALAGAKGMRDGVVFPDDVFRKKRKWK